MSEPGETEPWLPRRALVLGLARSGLAAADALARRGVEVVAADRSSAADAGRLAASGVEVRLGGNWTGKVEYLYLDFGKVSTTASLPTNSTPLGINFNSHVTDQIVRVGVNYKFDPNEIWAN